MKRYWLVMIMLIIAFLVGCGDNQEEVNASYKSDLQDVVDQMMDNALNAETIVDQYATVWSYSIESSSPIAAEDMAELIGMDQGVINVYFEVNNYDHIPNDFSTNIHSLNSYYDASGDLGDIEETSNNVKDKISELNEPPAEYEDVYEEVLNMYDFTEEYIKMAVNPSGSLQDFVSSKNQLADDILSKHRRIEVLMPNEE